MPTFIDFRDGRGGDMCRKLGVDISRLETWQGYTRAILSLPDRMGFIKKAMTLGDNCSSTERVIVAAILFSADLSSYAEKLDGGQFWDRANHFSDDTATTIAAAILRKDHQAAAQPALQAV